MNFKEFKEKKEKLLQENPELVDLSENNLYLFAKKKLNLNEITGESIQGHINGNVHRCHLVEDWLSHFSLPENFKNFIGVSEGVRHSLDILMNHFKNKNWYIPKDVYPVYQQKATSNLQKEYKEYSTLFYDNVFKVNGIPEDTDIILSINPVKPYGRKMLGSEIENLRHWLKGNPERRLIIDCVYMMDVKEDAEIFNLYNETGQVYLLFSLSKTWLLPQVFGITFIAKKDMDSLKNIFKTLKTDPEKLKIAYDALNNYKSRPDIVREMLINQIDITSKKGLEFGLMVNNENPSYFFYSSRSFEYWLEKGFLTLPASVFGAEHGVVVSTLVI